jgi:hypothetical protein
LLYGSSEMLSGRLTLVTVILLLASWSAALSWLAAVLLLGTAHAGSRLLDEVHDYGVVGVVVSRRDVVEVFIKRGSRWSGRWKFIER